MRLFLLVSVALFGAHAERGIEYHDPTDKQEYTQSASSHDSPLLDRFKQQPGYDLDPSPTVRPTVLTARCDLVKNPAAPFTLSVWFTFSQVQHCDQTRGPLKVTAHVDGFPPGRERLRGVHVHETGDTSNGCSSAGGHYNPLNMTHGGPNSSVRHVGDFGNFVARSDGTIRGSFRDRVANLTGTFNIIDRAVVVHAGEDDLGQVGNEGSLRTGNAGARLACCVIRST